MISKHLEKQTKRLLEQYSQNVSTDTIISFIADNEGMLESCRNVVEHIHGGDRDVRGWLGETCDQYNVNTGNFIRDIDQIIEIFHPRGLDKSYRELGLEGDADIKEVKRAYRKLSVKYHPDIVGEEDKTLSEKFITITQAYNDILNENQVNKPNEVNSQIKTYWRYHGKKTLSKNIITNYVVFFLCFTVIIIGLSYIVSQYYKQRVMLNTLGSTSTVMPAAMCDSDENEKTFSERLLLKKGKVGEKYEMNSYLLKNGGADNSLQNQGFNRGKELGDTAEDSLKTGGTIGQTAHEQAKGKISTIIAENTKVFVTGYMAAEKSDNYEKGSENKSNRDNEDETIFAKKKATSKNAEWKQVESLPVNNGEPIELPAIPDSPAGHDVNRIKQEVHSAKDSVSPIVYGIKASEWPRVRQFLDDYIAAYENKNIIKFLKYFHDDATENGVAIEKAIPAYQNLFDSAKEIKLRISILKCNNKMDDIELSGRFSIHLLYASLEDVEEEGRIYIVLDDRNNAISVKELIYEFDR